MIAPLPFYCPMCGRYGTEDDLCVLGEECPDEECGGIIRLISWDWEDVVDSIDHMLGTHEEFEHLWLTLKIAQAAVFYVRDHNIELEVT